METKWSMSRGVWGCGEDDLEATYHKVQQEGNYGTEIHQVHWLLEEPKLPWTADEPDTILAQEEQDGGIF